MLSEKDFTGQDVQDPRLYTPTINDFLSIAHARLDDIHSLLVEMTALLKSNISAKENADVFEIVTLYKVGFGRNWIPAKNHRQYIRIAAPVATAISVSSSLGAAFVVNVPAIALPNFWNDWDFPDQSSFMLDSTASANQMNIWVRFTEVSS